MRNLVLFLAALTAMAFVACSSDSAPTATTAPAPTVAPSAPTAAPSSRLAPTAAPLAPTVEPFPVTVTDLLGRDVEIEALPERILTIMPTATETLYRIGGQAIGRDTASRYPPEAQDLETVGSTYNPSLEAMAVLEPDLIVIEALTQGHLVGMLEGLGAPVIAVRANSLEDVEESLRVLGAAIDHQKEAARAATQIRAAVEDAVGGVESQPSALILISDADRNIYAAKPESYSGAIADTLGLSNLAAGLPDSGPFPGFTLMSVEQVLVGDPDVIFAISPAPPPAPRLSDSLGFIPGFDGLAAVQNGRVSELDPALFLSAPGPRFGEAAAEMARLVNETAP